MAFIDQFADFATSTVAGGAGGVGTALGASDVTLYVATGDGAKFPANGPFMLLIGSAASSSHELVKCYSRSGDQLTLQGSVNGVMTNGRGQEGTGASQWAVGAQVQEVVTAGNMTNIWNQVTQLNYNVKLYGATGNGVTDDTVAIQAALIAAQNTTGGVVFFPEGSYLISQALQVQQDNIRLQGAGWGAQLLAATSFSTTTGAMITVQAPLSASYRYGISMSELFLNGNNVAGVGGVQLASTYGARLEHMRIRYCPGVGVYFTGSSAARGAYTDVVDCVVTDGGAGTAYETFYAENNTILGGLVSWYNQTGGTAVLLNDGGNQVIGAMFDECWQGVKFASSNGNQVQDCQFTRGYQDFIYFNNATRNVVSGCYFDQYVGGGSGWPIIKVDSAGNTGNLVTDCVVNLSTGWGYFIQESTGLGASNLYANNSVPSGMGMTLVNGRAVDNLGYTAPSEGYNVRNYGALGDGVTDDRAAIQAALDACDAAGGGTVYFPAGTYALGSYTTITDGASSGNVCLAIGSKTRLLGEGMDQTIIKCTVVMPDQSIVVINKHYSTSGDTGMVFQDLTLDGNASIQTAPNHVNLLQVMRCQNVHFLRVRGKDSYGTGDTGAAEAFTLSVDQASFVSFVDCETVFTAPSTGGGMGGNYSSFVSLVNCRNHGSSKTVGFGIYGCSNVTYDNCFSYQNHDHGFNCEQSFNVTYNNCMGGVALQSITTSYASYPYSSGQTLGNTGYGFRVAYTNSYNIYYNNCIASYNGAAGFSVESGCSNIHFNAPTAQHNGTVGVQITDMSITSVYIDGRSVMGYNTSANFMLYINGAQSYVQGGGVQLVTPTVPASGVQLVSPYPWKSMVFIPNGVVSNITVNGGTQLSAVPGMLLVPAYGQVTMTYTSAPTTWTWVPLQG